MARRCCRRPGEGDRLLHDPHAARRVPDRGQKGGRGHDRGAGLQGGLARCAEPGRPAAQPARGRDQPQARRRNHERRRLRRDRAGDREGARGRHQGAELRPADPLDQVRADVRRRHGGDRAGGRRRGGAAAQGTARQCQGQGAADPGRSGRQLHPRHPERVRGGDGQGGPGRGDRHQGGDAMGGHQRRPGVRGPAPRQPRHRPRLLPCRPPHRTDRGDHGGQGHEARPDHDDGQQRSTGRARQHPQRLAAGRGRAAHLRPGLRARHVPAQDHEG